MSRVGSDLLFSDKDLALILTGVGGALKAAVDELFPDRVLGADQEQVVTEFTNRFSLDCPRIDREGIRQEVSPTKADLARHPDRYMPAHSQPYLVDATQVQLFVPFTGDAELFSCRPAPYTLNPPRAAVGAGELVLTAVITTHDAESLRKDLNGQVNDIEQWLGWMRAQVDEHNRKLPAAIRSHLDARRERLLKDQQLAVALGFEMRRRVAAPTTYSVPAVRRKPPVTSPPAGSRAEGLEPALTQEGYSQILEDLTSMMRVVELNPRAFQAMGEEDLRWVLLVPLNLYWEGGATGETFNYQGKTDIIIKVKGRNVFIAECKIWEGPASLTEAIDQIRSYSSWRDTKTAVLLFSRRREFSKVLQKIPETARAHPQFLRELGTRGETEFRFLFRHPEDPEREVLLTVLAFNVPFLSPVGGSAEESKGA